MPIPTQKLLSGHEMPVLGVGTWQVQGRECTEMVSTALDLGYTHLDTARGYDNHEAIRPALQGRDRSRIFLTSKVPPEQIGREDLIRSCDRSLAELAVDYLDLYLIHWPNPEVPLEESFGALGELVETGKIRSAGVSNYLLPLMRESLAVSPVPLCNNQVKFNPAVYPRQLLDYCLSQGITVTAYSPLALGRLIDNQILERIGAAHGKSAAQVSLRWLLQKGAIVIPRAKQKRQLQEDLEIFAWELTPEEVERLDNFPGQNDPSLRE